MAKLLDGVRVVELGTMITGPFLGMLLAEQGADVIKVENPDGGDPYRRHAAGFEAVNLGKRSVVLDLRTAEGREALLKLARHSDVLVENFRPGVMDRLGLGGEALHGANPRLIWCSITGFGTDGPYVARPAYDTVIQSLSGFLSLLADPDKPCVPGPPIADGLTGMYACQGILAALYDRERSGKGRRIEVNMLEALIHFANDAYSGYFRTGVVPGHDTRSHASQSYAFECADGKMFGIHLSNPEKFWQGLLATTGRQDLAADPRFATYPARTKNHAALHEALASVFRSQPRAHWLPLLEANEVPFAPIYRTDEVVQDPQVRHLGTFFDFVRGDGSAVKASRTAIRVDGQRPEPPVPPPTLGADTEAVLRKLD
ncbi:MAG: CaiB/BaiF CoA transferase family protein [Rhodospirillales bacterium]